ncbi:uncharacterized protein LOC134243530 [Saccostrea cucullata]|uniref:uncharacterized protein LOC134243530 n=1 Tax=Saccostrea cuccullata TaxID=36930 RepID=UPI002ED528A7
MKRFSLDFTDRNSLQVPSRRLEEDKVKVDVAAAGCHTKVDYILRDIEQGMVNAWKSVFPDAYKNVQISCGDIFKEAPAAHALVSPTNSFGFMDIGIDMVYSKHFGWQMQERLQKVIREEHDGEILVGQAVIIPAYDEQVPPKEEDLKGCNEEIPIKYLISAPAMRVSQCVEKTVNAYLAFRAVILAVQKHNKKNPDDKIFSVLCPGMGTTLGMMDYQYKQCAQQMCLAYETHELKLPQHRFRVCPESLWSMNNDHTKMVEIADEHDASPLPDSNQAFKY